MTTQSLVFVSGNVWRALANHLWQSTAFVALPWLFILPLRRNQARIRYRLWLIASVKFLIPFAILIRVGSSLPGFENHTRPPISMYYMVDVVSQPFSERIEPSLVGQTVQTTDLSHRIFASVPEILALLWFLGTVAVCIVWYLRWRQITGIRQRAIPIENGREIERLREVEAHSELSRGLGLLRSQEVSEPGIYGAFSTCFALA
jgi:bla regulator protein blaR1